MANAQPFADHTSSDNDRGEYRFLRRSQITMIDEALANVGDYGEVRLVVNRGKLRFVVTQTSHDALQWQPGSLGAAER